MSVSTESNTLNESQRRFLKKWLLISVISFVCLFCISYVWNKYYFVRINITKSLPGTVFLIKRHSIPTRRGQLFAFVPPPNPLYGQKYVFIKIVGGVPGDKVSVTGQAVTVHKTLTLIAKKYTEKGRKLFVDIGGTLGKKQYFAYTPHKDSYDSRYKEIGWINENQIVGVAYRLF